MADERNINELIAEATAKIAEAPADAARYMERAKLYYRAQDWGASLNDVLKVLELEPSNGEARSYEKMIRDIFEYRYTDYYNP